VQISVARPSELGPDEIAAWHSMQRKTESLANPFLCPEFAVAVDTFRRDARVAVLADGSEIVGFFPFQWRRLGVGVPIGAGLTDCQGLIHVPAAEWDPRELLRACRLSVWQFDHLVEGQRPFERYAVAVAPSPAIDLTNGFVAYQEKLRVKSPNFCRNIARKSRNLEREAGELRFVVDSRAMAGLRTLMGWKSDQYRRTGWSDRFARPWIVDFLDYLFSIRSDCFRGLLSLLYAGDTLVAAHFGLQSANVLVNWFPAYDTRFSKHSPGMIQHLRLAEESAATGVNLFDLGRGTERYKETLKSYELFVAQGRVTVGSLLAAADGVRSHGTSWARRRIRQHPHLLQATDQLLRRWR
jgi:CelD/BcsL family acetyltransferase involved in cellulose biosynthesis